MAIPHQGTAAFARRQPQLPAFCRSRRPTNIAVTTSSLIALRLLTVLVLVVQLSTLLLVLAGPMPLRPVAGSSTVFRPVAGTDAGEGRPVTPVSDR